MPASRQVDHIARKVHAGERLSLEDGVQLHNSVDMPGLAALATAARFQANLHRIVTYAAGLRLSWESLRGPGLERACRSIETFAGMGGTILTLAGNPGCVGGLEDVCRVLGQVKGAADQIDRVAIDLGDLLLLMLESGARLSDLVRKLDEVGPIYLGPMNFSSTRHGPEQQRLLRRVFYQILPRFGEKHTRARLFLAAGDRVEDRVGAWIEVRKFQDGVGGLVSTTPFNRSLNNRLCGSACDYLRTVALSRLMLDNIPHLQASWETQGMTAAQLALEYGADDLGTLWLKASPPGGPRFSTPIAELERSIREIGFEPRCRDARFAFRPSPQDPPAPASLRDLSPELS